MELKTFYAQDAAGNVVGLPEVTLYLADGETLANAFDADGNGLPNPFIGTDKGKIELAAANGDYVLSVLAAGRTTAQRVRFIDGAQVTADMASFEAALAALDSSLQSVAGVFVSNFSADGSTLFYSPMEVELDLEATFGAGAAAFKASSSADPATLAAITMPHTLEAGAWLEIAATGVTDLFAVAISRTIPAEGGA